PYFKDRFHLSYTLAALLMLASAASSSVIQPLFGLWSDRHGALWLLPSGVLLAGAGIAAAADAPSYGLVFALVVVSGLGVAAYPRGLEVRRVRERPASRERDERVLDRGQPRLRVRADRGRRGGRRLRAARRVAARRAVRPDRGGARRPPRVPRVVRARSRDGPPHCRRGCAGRAGAAARRHRVPQLRVVRADHLHPAVGGVARALE